MSHIWATCLKCKTEIVEDEPKQRGYKLPTKPCVECRGRLCGGTCRDHSSVCEKCRSLICETCMEALDFYNPICSSCAPRPQLVKDAA